MNVTIYAQIMPSELDVTKKLTIQLGCKRQKSKKASKGVPGKWWM